MSIETDVKQMWQINKWTYNVNQNWGILLESFISYKAFGFYFELFSLSHIPVSLQFLIYSTDPFKGRLRAF